MWVNVRGRRAGVVDAGARDAVVMEAERALPQFRDPLTGHRSFEVTRVREADRGLLGDLPLAHRPGYECRPEAGPGGAEVVDVAKGGTHITPTGESTLSGIVAVGAGPGPRPAPVGTPA